MNKRLVRFAASCLLLCVAWLGLAAPAAADEPGLDLCAYKGKVVYLDFRVSWCNPCRRSFPWMNGVQETYAQRGLVVIGVNVDHERALADEFLRKSPADFKIVCDPDGAVARQFDFKDMPTSVLIDRDRKVRFAHSGFVLDKRSEYAAHVRALLAAKAS